MNKTFKDIIAHPKKLKFLLLSGALIIFLQMVFIAFLFAKKDDKIYQINLVKIKENKDSVDLMGLKNSLTQMDGSIRNISKFLTSKNIPDAQLDALGKENLSDYVKLSEGAARYSEQLVQLEQKLQQVPLGNPTDGYISSNFGIRVNPIPPKKPMGAKTDKKSNDSSSVASTSTPTNKAFANQGGGEEGDGKPMQFHKGLDIAVPYGSDVKCTATGKVIFAGEKGGYGNCVIVEHGNGLATLYGHLSQVLVKANQEVKVGELIAKSGNTGRSTGPHLHYEVHKNNTPVNPKLFLSYK